MNHPSSPVSAAAALATRLGDLLSHENELLRTRRPSSLLESQAEKQRLTEAYERQMQALKAEPDALSAAPGHERAELRAAVDRFRSLLAEHGRRVAAARSVTERIVRTISSEVAKRQDNVQSYDRGASMKPAFGRGQKTVSLALNQLV